MLSCVKFVHEMYKFYLMEPKVILNGVRTEEDDSLCCHNQDEAI